MQSLLSTPLRPKPIFRIHSAAKILLIGQAPGISAHESGIPWNDSSGERLREWMGIDKKIFYKEKIISML